MKRAVVTTLLSTVFMCCLAALVHAQTLSWPTVCGGQIAVSPANVLYVSCGTGMCRYTTMGTPVPTSLYADYPIGSVNGLAISNDGFVWVALDMAVVKYSLEGDVYPGIELPRLGSTFTGGVAADDQYVYVQVSGLSYPRIAVYTHDGALVKELPGGPGEGVAVHDGYIYACDWTAKALTVYGPDDAVVRSIGQGVFTEPHGVAVSAGVVYVLDHNTVRSYTTEGAHLADWDVPALLTGIGVDSGGNVYVVGIVEGSPYVFKYAPVAVVPTTPSTWGALKTRYR